MVLKVAKALPNKLRKAKLSFLLKISKWRRIQSKEFNLERFVDYEGREVFLLKKIVTFRHEVAGWQEISLPVGIVFDETKNKAIVFIAPRKRELEDMLAEHGVVYMGRSASMLREAFVREQKTLEKITKTLAKIKGINTKNLKIIFSFGH